MLLQRPTGRAAAIVIVCLFGTNVSYVAALPSHTPGTAQLGGWVYIDRNNDGNLAFMNDPFPEFVIAGVTVNLYSQTGPEVLVATTQSDDHGRFFFNNLAPGTYGMKQVQPVEWVDGLDTVGQLFPSGSPVSPNAAVGTAAQNAFNAIVLTPNIRADFYLFGERGLAPGYVSKRFLLGSAPDPPLPVPEPATVGLVATAIIGCLLPRRRR